MQVDQETVVVITGASGGVGRATARLFADARRKVVLLARGREGLEGAKREVEERGGQALVVPTDVSQFDQVKQPPKPPSASSGRSICGSTTPWSRCTARSSK